MKNPKKYDLILESVLNRILIQGESLESAISDFSENQEQLRIDLDTALWFNQIGNQLSPRPGFVTSSRNYLVTNLNEISVGNRNFDKKHAFKNIFQPQWVLTIFIAFVFILGSLVAGMDQAVPGDLLYSVKTAMQDFRLFLTVDAEKEANLYRLYAQEHLIACARAVSQGRSNDAEFALWNYERYIAGMSRSVQKISKSSLSNSDWELWDVSRIYLQDIEIFKVLLPGTFSEFRDQFGTG